jgi:hypothetical protein
MSIYTNYKYFIRNIKNNLNLIESFKKGYFAGELPDIKIKQTLNDKYLRIISNIYYISLIKIQKIYKNDYLNKNKLLDKDEATELLDNLYNENIKTTRIQVLNFFKVNPIHNISPIVLIKLYPLYFSPYDEIRFKYDKLNKYSEKIINKMSDNYVFEILYNDNDTNPKDVKYINIIYLDGDKFKRNS